MLPFKALGALGAGLVALGVAAPAHATTFPVINTNDSGPGSLRSAIKQAEQDDDADRIEFELDGAGPHVITLAGGLPAIDFPVAIDGYSQAGSSPPGGASAGVAQIVINAANVSDGLELAGDGIEVRGLVIRNAPDDGILITGDDNVVAGNRIGTDADGESARGNRTGVHVDGGRRNTIGGPDAADRNVISGNLVAEVELEVGNGNIVQGNRIGTDAAGTAGLGAIYGVLVESDHNRVEDNLVADETAGVSVRGAGNVVRGNLVGTDATGRSALPNWVGIGVRGGDSNHIEGNLLSGNTSAGLLFLADTGNAATGNDAVGNTIGLGSSGAALPNGTGVLISASDENTLTGNAIAGNLSDGVRIEFEGADENRLEGNKIGLPGLGNGDSGVEIDGGERNHVGDPGNTIAFNGSDGVAVLDGSGNAIRRNSIHDNHGLGIDLGGDGPTPNDDNDDADTGPNQLQNNPEIQGATETTVDWELDTVPLTDYRLDFFANDRCDRTGSGEGQTFLGSILVHTNANGFVHADTRTAMPAGAGKQVSMTATRVVGAGTSRSTSEFSPCEPS